MNDKMLRKLIMKEIKSALNERLATTPISEIARRLTEALKEVVSKGKSLDNNPEYHEQVAKGLENYASQLRAHAENLRRGPVNDLGKIIVPNRHPD